MPLTDGTSQKKIDDRSSHFLVSEEEEDGDNEQEAGDEPCGSSRPSSVSGAEFRYLFFTVLL